MFASCISAAWVRTVTRLCALVLLVALGWGSELRVRVRLSDGLVTEEVLEADSERDTVSVEFKQGDGTLITYVADFKQVRDVVLFTSPSSKQNHFLLRHPDQEQNKPAQSLKLPNNSS